jgi:hypothetical protein
MLSRLNNYIYGVICVLGESRQFSVKFVKNNKVLSTLYFSANLTGSENLRAG